MAATIAIAQMNDHTNSQLLSDIFLKAFHASTSETLKKSIKQALLNILDPQSARLIKDLI
jgi:hypothetical protein